MDTKLSCIDCAVKNCDKMDKTFPEFCLTTNMDTEVLRQWSFIKMKRITK